ncbi:sirohydrochlorin chelatase [Pontibacillus salipaludis]|uniref:sirohydrochlorin chelatase n=1 Tax=Pontibacillus salipaludis TaxID=1697394 RepID=UPI0031EF4BE1
MMEAVLYVSHGSRVEETKEEAVSYIHQVHQEVTTPLFEICFLELAEPTMAQGIKRLVEKGATDITIVPVLLLSAGHYYHDIPDEIQAGVALYPNIRFKYGKPLGIQKRITRVLVDRIQEVASLQEDLHLVLVGRGSRNPETKASIEQIASWLGEEIGGASVDVCYLAACSPTFEEGTRRAVLSNKRTIVIPYLWFTGKLIQSMNNRVESLQQEGVPITMTHYLGDHPIMIQALAERVHEALVSEEWDQQMRVT